MRHPEELVSGSLNEMPKRVRHDASIGGNGSGKGMTRMDSFHRFRITDLIWRMLYHRFVSQILYRAFNIKLQPMRHPEEIIPRCGKTTQDEPDYCSRWAGSSVTCFRISILILRCRNEFGMTPRLKILLQANECLVRKHSTNIVSRV